MPFANRPSGWERTRQRVLARDGRVCHICQKPGADSIDHLTPRSKGGGHEDSNLAAAHNSCNGQRQDKDIKGLGPIRPKVKHVMPRARSSRWS